MELSVYYEDLKSEFRHLNASQTKFSSFKAEVQDVIRMVGGAMYRGNGTYNSIIVPNEEKVGVIKKSWTSQEVLKIVKETEHKDNVNMVDCYAILKNAFNDTAKDYITKEDIQKAIREYYA